MIELPGAGLFLVHPGIRSLIAAGTLAPPDALSMVDTTMCEVPSQGISLSTCKEILPPRTSKLAPLDT